MRYRRNVSAAVQNPQGELLICERLGMPGAWQFPQGGVKKRESLEAGVAREIREEIGLRREDYELRGRYGPYRYEFPHGNRRGVYDGQEQTVFLVRTHAARPRLRLDGHEREFARVRWIQPAEFRIAWAPEFKRGLFRAIFRDLFGIEL